MIVACTKRHRTSVHSWWPISWTRQMPEPNLLLWVSPTFRPPQKISIRCLFRWTAPMNIVVTDALYVHGIGLQAFFRLVSITEIYMDWVPQRVRVRGLCAMIAYLDKVTTFKLRDSHWVPHNVLRAKIPLPVTRILVRSRWPTLEGLTGRRFLGLEVHSQGSKPTYLLIF